MMTFFFLFFQLFAQNSIGIAENAPVFTLRVEQKKKDVPIIEHEVWLKKKFFDLVFEFNQPAGVACLVSLDSTAFLQAKAGKPISEIKGFENFGSAGMAEAPKNPDQDLMISAGAFQYWYYEKREDHRFSRTEHTKEVIRCWRTVGTVKMIDSNESFKIANSIYPIYLVFAQPDGSQIDYLKINWK
jgi:hypothetical protein